MQKLVARWCLVMSEFVELQTRRVVFVTGRLWQRKQQQLLGEQRERYQLYRDDYGYLKMAMSGILHLQELVHGSVLEYVILMEHFGWRELDLVEC